MFGHCCTESTRYKEVCLPEIRTDKQASSTASRNLIMLLNNILAAAALVSSAFAAPYEKRQNSTRKLKWFGINESGAEFGEKNFTGVYGKEYIWYDLNTIDQFMAQGMNMFRLNFCESSIIICLTII
jgi:aryl-phospho-beta-D-glucosidase BglC (GH1 family)